MKRLSYIVLLLVSVVLLGQLISGNSYAQAQDKQKGSISERIVKTLADVVKNADEEEEIRFNRKLAPTTARRFPGRNLPPTTQPRSGLTGRTG